MEIPPIEEMTHLAKRLGASGMDKIRYAGNADTTKQSNATNIKNTVIDEMQVYTPQLRHCRVNELIEAAANLDPSQAKPLNVNRLFNILQCISLINTREIITMTGLGTRQAQKYLQAVKIVLPHLEAHFISTADFEYYATPIRNS